MQKLCKMQGHAKWLKPFFLYFKFCRNIPYHAASISNGYIFAFTCPILTNLSSFWSLKCLLWQYMKQIIDLAIFRGVRTNPRNFVKSIICIIYCQSRHFKLQNKLKFVKIGQVEVEIWLFEIDAACPGRFCTFWNFKKSTKMAKTIVCYQHYPCILHDLCRFFSAFVSD